MKHFIRFAYIQLFWLTSAISCVSSQEGNPPLDLKIEFGKVARKSVFVSETQSIWGGSVVKGDDGQIPLKVTKEE